MDLLISNLWLISYKLSVFIIKWGKQRIVSIQSSASEKEKTPRLGQPACPYIRPPVVSLHLPDGVASPRTSSSSLPLCSSVKMKPAGTSHASAFLLGISRETEQNLPVCKVQMYWRILKGAEYLCLQWDFVLEVSPKRQRPLSRLPSNWNEFTELNGFTISLNLCRDGA